MTTTEKSSKEKVQKFDFSKIDFDVLRERELEEARRRREEMERIRREEEEAAREPPPVTYSEEEYQEAEKAAHEKGRQEGLKQATIEQNQQILDLVKNLVPTLQNLVDGEMKRQISMEKETVRMTVHIAQKMMPSLLKGKAAEELEAFILANLKDAEAKGVIKVTVHIDLKDVIVQRLKVMFDDKYYEDAVQIVGSKDIAIDACRIEWGTDSGIERDTGLVLEKIQNITQSFLSGETLSHEPYTPIENASMDEVAEDNMAATDEKVSQKDVIQESEVTAQGKDETVENDMTNEESEPLSEESDETTTETDLTSQETKDE